MSSHQTPAAYLTQTKALLGLLISLLPLTAASAPHYLPAIPIKVDLETKSIDIGDLNDDGYDDLLLTQWAPGQYDTNIAKYVGRKLLTLTIKYNRAKPKILGQPPEFTDQTIEIDTADRRARRFTEQSGRGEGDVGVMGGALLVDLNGDGHKDILAWSTQMGQAYILWNRIDQQPVDGLVYSFIPDNTDLDKTLTIDLPLSKYGDPVACTAGDIDGNGYPDIICYHVGLDGRVLPNKHYEAFSAIFGLPPLPGKRFRFDSTVQTRLRPGDDLALGKGAAIDGYEPGFRLFDYSLGAAMMINELYYNAAVDETPTGSGQKKGYADFPLQIQPKSEPDGRSSLWVSNRNGQIDKLVYDSGLGLFRNQDNDTFKTATASTRGASFAFAPLSDGRSALITSGGAATYYPPYIPGFAYRSALAEAFTQKEQRGAVTRVATLNSGPTLLTTSDYLVPGEGLPSDEYNTIWQSWYLGVRWGNPGLLLMQSLTEDPTSAPGKRRFQKLLESTERDQIQAFPMESSMRHKPQFASGIFAAPGERSLVILEDGTLNLYRPNDLAGSYRAPTPKLDGITNNSNDLPEIYTVGTTLIQGEEGIITGDLGSGIAVLSDSIRYILLKQAGTTQRILPVKPLEKDTTGNKFRLMVPALKTLPEGTYTLEAWNSNQSATLTLQIVKPFNLLGSDRDMRSGRACGIVPTTSGGRYPSVLRLKAENLPADQLQEVRWIRQTDKKTWSTLPAAGGLRVEGDEIILPTPLLESGKYRIWVKASGYWRPLPTGWTMTDDDSVCGALVKAPNHLTVNQCDDTSLRLESVTYDHINSPTEATRVTVQAGDIRFLGRGFAQWGVKSVLMEQAGGIELWDDNARLLSEDNDNRLQVNWGDLSGKLTIGQPVTLKFFTEKKDTVKAQGIKPVATLKDWRTPVAGKCGKLPPVNILPSSSSEEWKPFGKSNLKVQNAAYPWGDGSQTLPVITLSDGSHYALPFGSIRINDDWYDTPQTTASASYTLQLPGSLVPYKVLPTHAIGGTTWVSMFSPITFPPVPPESIPPALTFALSQPELVIPVIAFTTVGYIMRASFAKALFSLADVVLKDPPPSAPLANYRIGYISHHRNELDPLVYYVLIDGPRTEDFRRNKAIISKARDAIIRQGRGRYSAADRGKIKLINANVITRATAFEDVDRKDICSSTSDDCIVTIVLVEELPNDNAVYIAPMKACAYETKLISTGVRDVETLYTTCDYGSPFLLGSAVSAEEELRHRVDRWISPVTRSRVQIYDYAYAHSSYDWGLSHYEDCREHTAKATGYCDQRREYFDQWW